MSAMTRIIIALTISALAALALPLARNAEPAPAAPQKCTQVLAPGDSC